MRSREEMIEEIPNQWNGDHLLRYILEVLLDIREIINHIEANGAGPSK